MIGGVRHREKRLFHIGFDLEERIPAEHPLRAVRRLVDFSFVRREVAHLYGDRGHESEDPIVVMKLFFLKFFEGVDSVRGLMRQLPLRLDWMWFCEFDLDDEIPDHSILSKAKRRWGGEVFLRFFEQIVKQCVEAGLVDGEVVHVDASVIRANASMDSIISRWRLEAEAALRELEDEQEGAGSAAGERDEEYPDKHDGREGPADRPEARRTLGQRISRTDPDARLTRQSTLGYKDHRVVDDRCGVVTATVTTPANAADEHQLEALLRKHEAQSGSLLRTVVADRLYGTTANYRMLYEAGVRPCIPHKRVRESRTKFARSQFVYDAEHDHYVCPAGETLGRRAKTSNNRYRYHADRAVCARCSLRDRCSDDPRGRGISRQIDQGFIDWADGCYSSEHRKRLMGRRRARAEGSFADAANRHRFKRMTWRGLESAAVQNHLIATVQNVRKLIRAGQRNAARTMAQILGSLARHSNEWQQQRRIGLHPLATRCTRRHAFAF